MISLYTEKQLKKNYKSSNSMFPKVQGDRKALVAAAGREISLLTISILN